MFSPSPARPITPQNIQLADPKTRAEVAREWWSHCTPESQAQLLSDENSQVRVEASYSKRQADVSALVARGVITVQDIQQLLRAKGDWVRRMALRRATGMRPHEVGEILDELKHAGLIEFSDSMDIHHPLHGFMGQTRGYRIPRTDQEAA